MELGKGHWGDSLSDLAGLRNQLIEHMKAYERILVLRCLCKKVEWHYELVEIPKALLQESAQGRLSFAEQSRQNPKPGYCNVYDEKGVQKYQLYFDAGSERKLQIRHIRKDLCKVHAEWKFPTDAGDDGCIDLALGAEQAQPGHLPSAV